MALLVKTLDWLRWWRKVKDLQGGSYHWPRWMNLVAWEGTGIVWVAQRTGSFYMNKMSPLILLLWVNHHALCNIYFTISWFCNA